MLSLLLRCDLTTNASLRLQYEEDDDDVRDIGKHDFRSVLLHPMLANVNPAERAGMKIGKLANDHRCVPLCNNEKRCGSGRDLSYSNFPRDKRMRSD